MMKVLWIDEDVACIECDCQNTLPENMQDYFYVRNGEEKECPNCHNKKYKFTQKVEEIK